VEEGLRAYLALRDQLAAVTAIVDELSHTLRGEQ
jgi:hypothetical protein